MERHSWIVSNPPYYEVDQDAAAELLGLTIAEFRIKVNFAAPEVWLAYPEVAAATEAASALGDVGLRVCVIPGPHLARVPWAEPVTSFAFEDDRFVAVFEEETIELSYDVPVIGVFCRPPAGADALLRKATTSRLSTRRQVGLATVKRHVGSFQDQDPLKMGTSLESSANLDLYVAHDETLRRITIAQSVADFSGLGGDLKHRSAENMDTALELCEQRFTQLWVDKRLVDVRPRRRFVGGAEAAGHDARRLFSFGTVGLRDLIRSASPELGDITQYELGSRLAYLMRSQAGAASAWVS